MKGFLVSSSKGQLKVQQMAFVLIAIVIFFVLIGLVVLYLSLSSLENTAQNLEERETLEQVRKLASNPEFIWTSGQCASCIDLDKVLVLKERQSYKGFWDFSLLRIERVYPRGVGECTRSNYPDCGEITLIEKEVIPSSKSSFVSLCRYEASEDYFKCELGKIIVGSEDLG